MNPIETRSSTPDATDHAPASAQARQIVARPENVRADRVRARRRVAMRIGLLIIAVTSATACIFDRSTYQGGGRTDHGATAATMSATDTIPTATTPPADGGSDAGLGAD